MKLAGLNLLLLTSLPVLGGSVAAQPLALAGLSGEAVVSVDSGGVPHVCASSEADVFFVQGYLQAKDRFFQMDTSRRTFSGTLAELLGEAALSSDVQLRTLGIDRAAARSLVALQRSDLRQAIDALQAFSEGVNAFLETGQLPEEYATLGLSRAREWTPLDSLVVLQGVAFSLSFDLEDLERSQTVSVFEAAGQAQGFDGRALVFEDLFRFAPFEPTVSIPKGAESPATGPAPAGARDRAAVGRAVSRDGARTRRLIESYVERIADVPALRRFLERDLTSTGSNWWVVSGESSESGHAMLAFDPHLALDMPSTLAPVGLATGAPGALPESCGSPGLNVAGVALPGVPGLYAGCNDRLCWGAASNPVDVTDVYEETLVIDPGTLRPTATLFEGQAEPLLEIPQTFLFHPVGGDLDELVDAQVPEPFGGVTLIAPRRNDGPIVAVLVGEPTLGLSVQFTGWSASTELAGALRLLHAEDLADFESALQLFDVGSRNWAYADVEGNVAFLTSGEIPLREDLQTLGAPDGGVPPFLVRDGTHALNHEWLPTVTPEPEQSVSFAILPADELPRAVGSTEGFLLSANNDPIGLTVDNDPLNQQRPGGGAYYLSPAYADGLRAGRIARLLEDGLASKGLLARGDLEAFQANQQMLDAELLAPFLIGAFDRAVAGPPELATLAADAGIAEAIDRLRSWDHSTPTGIAEGFDVGDDPALLAPPGGDEVARSVAATLWSVFRGRLVRVVVDGTLARLGLDGFGPGSAQALSAVAHQLETFDQQQGVGASGVDFWPSVAGLDREQSRDHILLSALRDALDLLAGGDFAPAFGGSTSQDDYRWGKLHRIVFDHPLGGSFGVPPGGGFESVSESLPGVARGGGYATVDVASHGVRADGAQDFRFGSGAAWRLVAVLDPAGIEAVEALPGGRSGNLADPLRTNQLGDWLTNGYRPLRLSREDIAADTVDEVVLQPRREPCSPGPETLCLQGDRFRVRITWAVPVVGKGQGRVVDGASDISGNFYFFEPENWEMLVKVIDGCSLNDRWWVFAAGATDLEWELVVEDTQTGEVWTTVNPLGRMAPTIADTKAFATCP